MKTVILNSSQIKIGQVEKKPYLYSNEIKGGEVVEERGAYDE